MAVTGRQPTSQHASRAPHGFTLLELLLALTLAGVIMTSVYGAVHLHWNFKSASEQRITTSQIAFGIVEDITLDLRSAVIPPFSAAAETTESAADPFVRETPLPDTDFGEKFLDLDPVSRLDPVCFFGDRHFFVLTTSAENPRFRGPHSEPANDGTDPTVVRHVAWWYHDGRTIRVPLLKQDLRLRRVSLNGGRTDRGLARAELQSSLIQRSGSPGASVPKTRTVSSDVSRMEFRYFDGDQWQTQWNSATSARLPNAVEIGLYLVDEAAAPVRCVVQLPQSIRRVSATKR